jgi:UDP-N-acetylglucosamine:LPS N-acetylglucosamine transferase
MITSFIYITGAFLFYATAWLCLPKPRRRWLPLACLAVIWPLALLLLPVLLWLCRAVRPQNARPKALLVCSSGGHLLQMHGLLAPLFSSYDRVWVSFKKADAQSLLKDEPVIWAYSPTNRNIPNLLRNLFLSVAVMLRERPSVIISTGAGVAIPFYVVGWLLGIKTIYLESFARKTGLSLTGRGIYYVADHFVVQSEQLAKRYARALYMGTAY